MQTNVTFRHTKGQHPNLSDDAKQIADGFAKYYDGIISTNVEFLNEAEKSVQFTVQIQGSTIVGKDSSDDFGKSLHLAADKVVRQLKKWKTKHNTYRP